MWPFNDDLMRFDFEMEDGVDGGKMTSYLPGFIRQSVIVNPIDG